MRLSIVNYGTGVNVDVPRAAKREDDGLIKLANEIIAARQMGKGGVMVAEVMHTDLMNLNYREYLAKGMPESVRSFYDPHFTPFLMHHENGSTNSSVVSVGVNVAAQFFRKTVETPRGTASGYVKVATFIPETVRLPNGQPALDALQTRQLLTLSIGARIEEQNYICNICGNSLFHEDCTHSPGRVYDDVVCKALISNPFFREYSDVYNPADVYAAIRRVDIMDAAGDVALREESVIDQNYGGLSVNIYEVGATVFPSADITTSEVSDMPDEEVQESTPDPRLKELNDLVEKLSARNGELEKDLSETRQLLTALIGFVSRQNPSQESGDSDEGDGDEEALSQEDTEDVSEDETSAGEASDENGTEDDNQESSEAIDEGTGEGTTETPEGEAHEGTDQASGNEDATEGAASEEGTDEQTGTENSEEVAGDEGTADGSEDHEESPKTSISLRQVIARSQSERFSPSHGYKVRSIVDVINNKKRSK